MQPYCLRSLLLTPESLFANSSSSERKYWGFSVLSRALSLVPGGQLPFLFTPNVMRCWINNLASSDRYLYKAAQNLAKQVQETVKANPTVGFTLLSVLIGKGGRPDFDKVTKTKTVETIMSNLTEDGADEYVKYLESIILGGGEKNSDQANLDERRQWALDQLSGLFRNGSVPKKDSLIQSVLELLLVNAFFIIRKTEKKSPIAALRTAPKPPLSEVTAAACRAKFFTCLVETTIATPSTKEGKVAAQGCDASGDLWLRRIVNLLTSLEKNKHVELALDADEEIRSQRTSAVTTLTALHELKASEAEADVKRGVEILLSFSLLQTYDESDDALELLEEANEAAQAMFKLPSKAGSSGAQEDAPQPIDALVDVLVAFLDKGSADLRNLANLVVGMVASAFTPSSIEHLVAVSHTTPHTTGLRLTRSNWSKLPQKPSSSRQKLPRRQRQRTTKTKMKRKMRKTRKSQSPNQTRRKKTRPTSRLIPSSAGESLRPSRFPVSATARMGKTRMTQRKRATRRYGRTSKCSRSTINSLKSSVNERLLPPSRAT